MFQGKEGRLNRNGAVARRSRCGPEVPDQDAPGIVAGLWIEFHEQALLRGRRKRSELGPSSSSEPREQSPGLLGVLLVVGPEEVVQPASSSRISVVSNFGFQSSEKRTTRTSAT